jgi:hypothetical protein
MKSFLLHLFRAVRRVAIGVAFVLLALGMFALVPYALTPVYDFPQPKPFHGDSLFNPYANYTANTRWLKANFHAHSEAWGGLTNGKSPLPAMSATYKRLGYDIAVVSNYHRMDTLPDFAGNGAATWMPAYEHGYGVFKNHQICLGANEVVWSDYVFGQNMHHKQRMLNRLKEVTPVVILAHPCWLDAYTPEAMRHVTGYDCLEVFNHFRESVALWDAALSAGHAVWAVGDDDAHDAADAGENGVCWTMLDAPNTSREAVLGALRSGRCYAVKLNSLLHDRWRGMTDSVVARGAGVLRRGIVRDSCQNALNDCRLKRLAVNGDSITVQMDTNAVIMRFIGQNGVVRKTALLTNTAGYRFTPEDSYIRVEIISPNTTLLLNPVVRRGRKEKHDKF